jgi:hypothetical protein
MKKIVFLVLLVASFVMASGVAYPAERMPLGQNNFAIKLDSIHFTDNALKGVDNAFYIGFEGYGDLGQNFYLGAEVGYVDKNGKLENSGVRVDNELIFIPIELNLKYAVKIVSGLVFDLGAGFSYNYAKEDVKEVESGVASSLNEWLWGGQFFADLNYKIGQFFLGANAKYQLTKSGKDFGNNFNNVRVGGQVGIMF